MAFSVASADKLAVGLSEWAAAGSDGCPPRTDTPGCVLVGAYGWADNNAGYTQLSQRTAALGKELYVYPSFPSHITVPCHSAQLLPHWICWKTRGLQVSTLSKSTNLSSARAVATAEQDRAFMTEWAAALTQQLAANPVPAFELVASRIELTQGAAIIHFDDPTGSMSAVRSLVEQAAAQCEGLIRLNEQLGGAVQQYHVPNIIHSSYARFVSPVTAERGEVMMQGFEEIACGFEPFTITVDMLHLINECSAYMHQSRADGIVQEYHLSAAAGGKVLGLEGLGETCDDGANEDGFVTPPGPRVPGMW